MSNKYQIKHNSSFFGFILYLIGSVIAVQAQEQINNIPKQEVRAVWLTTVLGLDWPSKSKNMEEQKSSLLEIIDKTSSAKFNTIFFQVRGRSDAMYKSEFEPWSHLLTGELGKDPGWDPLQFVIDESHKRGVEVHAWFNTFLIKSGKDKPTESKPRHLILSHPEWLLLVKGEWWLDPGIPEAREYLSNVALDIVRRYDIDGFQFDFMRYPPNGFPDDATWKKFGNNQPKAEWRRENINNFVRAFYDTVLALKPMLKIGATPIGIYNVDVYKNGMKGFEDVYQDAKAWLREGKMDYIVPQVYWSLKDSLPGPDFALITNDWVQGSNGRHVYVGIAAYKDDVFSQLPTLIDTSRDIGTNGHAFFRYEHIRRMFDSIEVYNTLANIPPMKWKDSIPPNSPLALNVERESNKTTTVTWRQPRLVEDDDTVKRYNIYRSKLFPVDISKATHLYRIVNSNTTSLIDTLFGDSVSHYHYAVTALDNGNNESTPIQEGIVRVPEVLTILEKFQTHWKLRTITFDEELKTVIVPIEVAERVMVKFSIWDAKNDVLVRTFDEEREVGRNIVSVDVSGLGDGEYLFKVESPNFASQQKISLQR